MRNYKKLLVAALRFVTGASTTMAQQMADITTDPGAQLGTTDDGQH